MAFSQNGGLVVENGDPGLIFTHIPGTDFVQYLGGIKGADLNTIAMYWGARWHAEVEPILPPAQVTGQWGHEKRDIRGSATQWSNHASGTAWDTNAAKHPLGTRTLSSKQLATLAQMVTALRGAVRSGAFYSGRVDEMHCEQVGSSQLVSEVASLIRAGQLPNTHPDLITNPAPAKPSPAKPSKPAPASPTKTKEWYEMPLADDVKAELAKLVHDETLKVVQQQGVGLDPTVYTDLDAHIKAAVQSELLNVLTHQGVGLTQDAIDSVVRALGK